MNFCYLIIAHDKPKQLKFLVSQLIHDNDKVIIHIDKKSDINIFINELMDFIGNIIFVKNRIDVKWGGFSMLEATFELFNEYINSGYKADYIHLLSNSCLPIKDIKTTKQFFIENKGSNFLDCEILDSSKYHYSRIINKWYGESVDDWLCLGYNYDINLNLTYYNGSQWFSITDECLSFLYNDYLKKGYFYNLYKTVQIPDEMYFQTVIMNSDFKDTLINNNLRYINWKNCTNHPNTLNYNDIGEMPIGKFWARKFDLNLD